MTLEDIFRKKTGRSASKTSYVEQSYIVELPDFDFDIDSTRFLYPAERLSLKNGISHPVAYSIAPLPWSLTKESCDRLGIPHIDVINSTILEKIDDFPPVEELETDEVFQKIQSDDFEPYHLSNWKKYLQALEVSTIEDLAMLVGLIRPKIREMFLESDTVVRFQSDEMNEALAHPGVVVYQEDFINLIRIVYNCSLYEAEWRRKKGKVLDYLMDDPFNDKICQDDLDILKGLYKLLSPHAMAKGHCLSVAYLILCKAKAEL